MDKIQYIQAFYKGATQLNGLKTGREWCEMGVSLDDAIAWANLGNTPSEAAPLIAAGMTPALVAAAEADERSHEERAASMIDDLVADGTLIDPSRVRITEDPDDPTHVIVNIG